MTLHNRRLFHNLAGSQFLNLAVAAVLLSYVILMLAAAAARTMCSQIGADYCDYWSAGHVANTQGYPAIYDLDQLGQVERSIVPPGEDPSLRAVVPFPYFPVFVLPFQLLSRLAPAPGFWIWTALNAAAYVLYLRFFARALSPGPLPARILLLFTCSLPVFFSFLGGQANVWLMICVGEVLRGVIDGHAFRAGVWLGGLLLKPQFLVLVVVFFTLQRAGKLLAGFAAASAAILGVSGMLLGPAHLVRVPELWLLYSRGQASNWVEGMMNWRMLGLHLNELTGSSAGWILAGAGILTTIAVAVLAWRKPFRPGGTAWRIAILGILAATTLVAWHSHIHTAMILVPPLLLLLQDRTLTQSLFHQWIFIPAGVFLFTLLVPEALVYASVLPASTREVIWLMWGGSVFAVNALLLAWSVRASHRVQD